MKIAARLLSVLGLFFLAAGLVSLVMGTEYFLRFFSFGTMFVIIGMMTAFLAAER